MAADPKTRILLTPYRRSISSISSRYTRSSSNVTLRRGALATSAVISAPFSSLIVARPFVRSRGASDLAGHHRRWKTTVRSIRKFQIVPNPWDTNHAKVVVQAAAGSMLSAKALMPKIRKKVLPYKSAK
jgi:hypothetical protein